MPAASSRRARYASSSGSVPVSESPGWRRCLSVSRCRMASRRSPFSPGGGSQSSVTSLMPPVFPASCLALARIALYLACRLLRLILTVSSVSVRHSSGNMPWSQFPSDPSTHSSLILVNSAAVHRWLSLTLVTHMPNRCGFMVSGLLRNMAASSIRRASTSVDHLKALPASSSPPSAACCFDAPDAPRGRLLGWPAGTARRLPPDLAPPWPLLGPAAPASRWDASSSSLGCQLSSLPPSPCPAAALRGGMEPVVGPGGLLQR
ncbi:MAG: hypothetical protein J3K34DRAFT_417133 [Monoraphidium minutum]|nr:MAG: hypothetical protein J3K34DRAFT_417133 [Monoraphidium minutum]